MDIDQLQAVRDRERDREGLQELRASFYEEAAEFVRELRGEREQAAREATDPFDDPRVTRLTDRIRTAEGTLEAIYEKRVAKILTAATLAAADLPAEVEGMTTEEAALFETLVAEIETHREEVLGRLTDEGAGSDPVPGTEQADAGAGAGDEPTNAGEAGGEAASSSDRNVPTDDETAPGGESRGDAGGPWEGSADPADGGPSDAESTGESGGEAVERTLVRITDDVGSILGVDDREYDLAEDDVVTLPAANAQPLVERGAAERLE